MRYLSRGYRSRSVQGLQTDNAVREYLSDIRKSKIAEYENRYQGDKVRIERAMARERFIVAEECTFDNLYAHRNDNDIGQTINTVLEKIEDANKAKLHNVFRNIDFNSEANLGQTRQRNTRLKAPRRLCWSRSQA